MLKKELRDWNIGKELISYVEFMWHESKKDWKNYATSAIDYVNYIKQDDQKLNEIAWNFYKHLDDKKLLQQAKQWSKKSIELKNNYANNDTYASILYKLGKKKEAKAAAEKAIELAKKENKDYKSTEELLKKINVLK